MVQVALKTFLSFIFLLSVGFSNATIYYVNDGSITGDIFCTGGALGSDAAGRGLTTGTPCATVQYVINNYVLTGSDIVKIDAGTYSESIIVTSADAGTSTSTPLTFQGAGKTLTIFSNTNFIWDIQSSCSFVTIKNMKCTCSINNHVIITSATSSYVRITYCDLYVNPASSTCGVQLSGDHNSLTYCSVTSSGFGVRLFASSDSISFNTITNTFSDVNSIGIWLNNSSSSFILQNKCYNSAGVGGGQYGLQLVNNGGTGCYIFNNYFANYKIGVFCNDGTANSARLKFNSIYATQSALYGRPDRWDIFSNIFYTTSASATDYCFYTVNENPTTLNRNLYFHPLGATAAQFVASNYPTLAALVASGRGFEANGYEGDPKYSAPASGNLDLTLGSIAIDKTILPIEGLTIDVRNAPRPTSNLDIGAYEYGVYPLPIELLYFNATPVKDAVLLTWTTASETNNDYFVVERSSDALNFHSIGTVRGAGNSIQLLNYRMYDREGLGGIIYYRLKQVDYDGKFAYSKIIPVRFEFNSSFSVYPNLVSQNNFEITIHQENRKGPVDITLYSLTGILIAEEKKLPEPNAINYTFNLDKPIAAGYYILKVNSAKGSNTEKIIVY